MPKATNTQTPRKKSGLLIATYHDRPLRWLDFFSLFLPATLAVLTPLYYGHVRGKYAIGRFGPAVAESFSKPWFLLAAFGLIPLLILAIRRIRRSHRIIKLYQNGILIQNSHRTKKFIFWEGIDGVAGVRVHDKFLGTTFRKKHLFTIVPKVGNSITLNHGIGNLAELCDRIKAKVYPKLLPNYRKSIYSGELVSFGSIRFNSTTINIQGKGIPWEQISQIHPQSGFLIIEVNNQRRIKIPIQKIHNVELLIQLIQEGLIT